MTAKHRPELHSIRDIESAGAMLLCQMLTRGDVVMIRNGRLSIEPASGQPVPERWLCAKQDALLEAIVRALKLPAYRFRGYSAGKFNLGRHSGVNLRFAEIVSGLPAYVIFNAKTTRARNSRHGKAGSALPNGQFRVGAGSKFVEFWSRTGLAKPRRLAAFHDYMGNLKPIIFRGSVDMGEKLNKDSLSPLEVNADQVAHAIFDSSPDNHRTNPGLTTDNSRTSVTDKILAESEITCGFRNVSGAGLIECGNEVKGNAGIRPYPNHKHTACRLRANLPADPADWTIAEWLEDLGPMN